MVTAMLDLFPLDLLLVRHQPTRGVSCGFFCCDVQLLTIHFITVVFETELVGIEGVPKPESIVTKSATDAPESTASAKVVEKVASVAKQAAEVVETIIADTDDTQEHNEL